MPSAPLFYQPLVTARVLATPLGKTTVYEAQQAQAKLVSTAYENPKYQPKMDAIMRGFEKLQSGMAGSKSLDHIQFAFDDDGYVANRVTTSVRLHPDLFDTASPEQAAQIGASLVEQARKELADNPRMRAVGDTLEVAPDVSQILKAHWEGEDIGQQQAAYVGLVAARELQRAVTPLDPDTTSPDKQWIEDATLWTMAMWPGAAAKTAAAIGLKADAAQIDDIVKGWREHVEDVDPKAAPFVRSLGSILGAAGVTVNDATAYDAAYKVLQGTPLDGVPAGIAQGIVAHNELPADQSSYYAGRIVETGGTAGNVKGLLAEIELAKRPPPVDPPSDGKPPSEDPPPGGTPPTGEDPPGTDPKDPPVDPPKDPKKPDEPKKPESVAEQAAETAKLLDELAKGERTLTEEQIKKLLEQAGSKQ